MSLVLFLLTSPATSDCDLFRLNQVTQEILRRFGVRKAYDIVIAMIGPAARGGDTCAPLAKVRRGSEHTTSKIVNVNSPWTSNMYG